MKGIRKCDKQLKLLSFLNESAISFEIFSEHNGYHRNLKMYTLLS